MAQTPDARKPNPELMAPAERRRAALKPVAEPRRLPPGPDDRHRGDDAPQFDYESQDG